MNGGFKDQALGYLINTRSGFRVLILRGFQIAIEVQCLRAKLASSQAGSSCLQNQAQGQQPKRPQTETCHPPGIGRYARSALHLTDQNCPGSTWNSTHNMAAMIHNCGRACVGGEYKWTLKLERAHARNL